MKIKINNIKDKKGLIQYEEGSSAFMGFLPILMVTIFVALIAIQYIGFIRELEYKEAINMIMRKYIIRMETVGYLTEEEELNIKSELQDIGMENIDLLGSTTREVEYGETIYLYVKGNIQTDILNIINILEGKWETDVIQIDEKRSSTSQQG